MAAVDDAPAPELRTCEQCHEEYVAGTGTTEQPRGSRVQLTERFCSESCADQYERDFDDDEGESDGG